MTSDLISYLTNFYMWNLKIQFYPIEKIFGQKAPTLQLSRAGAKKINKSISRVLTADAGSTRQLAGTLHLFIYSQ